MSEAVAEGVSLHELPDGRTVLSDVEHGRLLVVNDLGAAVWELLVAGYASSEIVDEIVEQLAASPAEVRRDVEAFLAELRKHALLG